MLETRELKKGTIEYVFSINERGKYYFEVHTESMSQAVYDVDPDEIWSTLKQDLHELKHEPEKPEMRFWTCG